MYKRIVLIALLLPFSGYAQTKQERREEIVKEVQSIESYLMFMQDVVKNNFWVMVVNPTYFRDLGIESQAKLIALQKEYNQLEKELTQEDTCTKS